MNSQSKLNSVLQSRKLWAAVVGLIFILVNAVLNNEQIDPNVVTNAIMAIVAAYIGATAYEDSQQAKAAATVDAATITAASNTTTTVTTPSENVTVTTADKPARVGMTGLE